MRLSLLARIVAKLLLGTLAAVAVLSSSPQPFFAEVVALVWFVVGVTYALRQELLLFIGLAAVGVGVVGAVGVGGQELVTFVTIFVTGLGLASTVHADVEQVIADRTGGAPD